MKERGILYTGGMVRRILANAKWQTRRIVKFEYASDVDAWHFDGATETWRMGCAGDGHNLADMGGLRCPYGVAGDRLWVRETWQAIHGHKDWESGHYDDWTAAPEIPKDSQQGWWSIAYAATDPWADEDKEERGWSWRPGIHMPRWASRITLDVVGVRVERLHDISAEDVIAEGIDATGHTCPCEACCRTSTPCPATASSLVMAYADLWAEINGRESWDANPWVWAIEFRRAERDRLDGHVVAGEKAE